MIDFVLNTNLLRKHEAIRNCISSRANVGKTHVQMFHKKQPKKTKKKKAANKKQGHSYIPSHKIYMEKGLESNL